MAPGTHGLDACQTLPSCYVSILAYHPVTIRQNREHGAQFCLGESPEFKQFDLCYSFKTLVQVEYGGVRQLYDTAWNYWNNRLLVYGNCEDTQMSYEKALRNPVASCSGTTLTLSSITGPRRDTGPSWHSSVSW